VGGADGRGQERYEEETVGCGRQAGWCSGRTSGGADGPQGSGIAALIEVVVRDRFRFSGIELGALVEVVGEGFLGDLFCLPTDLFCLPTAGPHGELGLGWAPSGVDQRGGGGLAHVGEDLGDGLGLGEERDEGERRLTGGTDQREDFIDPSEKSGPPGGPGGGGIGCVPFYPLWLESRGRGFCRERKRGTGSLGGQGVILPGPFGDEGSQGRIGGKDPVVSVTMDAGWGKDRGQAIQDTERSGVRRRGGVGWAVRGGNSRAERRRAVRPARSGPGRM
jgi:hypothetical protein